MKFKFTYLILFLSIFTFAQNEFITIWKPSNPAIYNGKFTDTNNNQINFPGFGTNYNIYWEEVGDSNHNGTINNVTTQPLDAYSFKPQLIDFGNSQNPNPLYMVKVSNGSGNFSAIDFNGQVGADQMKIVDVKQWGNIKWKIKQNPGITFFNGGFYNCQNLDITAIDLPDFSLNTSLLSMFFNCKSLKGNSSFSSWDTSTINDMQGMFQGATLFNADIGQWNTSNVTKMFIMFYDAENFNQNIGNWNTSTVWTMQGMFTNAKNFNQNIGNWNTAIVRTMFGMFNGATAFNQNIGNWDTGSVVHMSTMFEDATNFNQNIGNWNTGSVERMFDMFNGAKSFNQNIGNWNVSKVELMQNMFSNASSFNQNLENWNIKNVRFLTAIFKNSNLSCINYDKILIGWRNNIDTPNNVTTFRENNVTYSSPEAVMARNYLINTKGWTISGDTYDPSCALATNEINIERIQIFPNPAKEIINIQSKLAAELNYKITDLSGRLLINGKSVDKKINLQKLKTGNYMLELTDSEGKKTVQKFIKE